MNYPKFDFMTTLQEIADRWIDANPSFGGFFGISRTYGNVFDYTPLHFELRVERLREDIKWIENHIGTIDPSDDETYLEVLVVQMRLNQELFEKTGIKFQEIDPSEFFSSLDLVQGVYTVRSYAPLNKRIQHIISTEISVMRNLRYVPKYLDDNLSKVRIQIALLMLNAHLGYFKDNLIEFVVQTENSELLDKWSVVNEKLVESLENYKNLLETKYLPQAKDDFALGRETYMELLRYNELVDLTPEELLDIANKDLERNYNMLQKILEEKGESYLEEFFNDFPDPKDLHQEAAEATERAKQFIVNKDLVTIAVDDQVIVKETPDAMRPFTFAAMNPSGIAEDTDADESYYYITSPDPDWDESRTEEFMKKSFARGALETITIHEVWPGHFHHTMWIKQLKSKILRQLAFSTTTLEGWAHYTEELVIEQGYDLYDPTLVHVGQLQWALIRNCRFVSSIKMHTMGMSVEESKELFMEKGLLGEDAALKEARRGTFNPEYLNYTLGKLMIMKLRDDYRAEKSEEFSLKQFHDEFMRYGCPPVVLLRKILLDNPGERSDVL